MNRKIHLSLAMACCIALYFSLSGCKKDQITVDRGVAEYLQDLPTWDEFSPPLPDQPAAPTGDPITDEGTVTLDVEEIQEDGSVKIIPDVEYSCQSVPYSITQNPNQIVMYSPDIEILYPGGLIQGKSHRDGLGSLLGINIAERTPIKVSIPGLQNDDNFRLVEAPSQATVAQAIGSMVGNATLEGLSTPSSISFDMESYHSEKEFALSMGISGNYLGFSASASGSIDQERSETTVTAQFYQKMYEVVVEPPQTPGAFFSEAFTQEKLQEQVDLGKMGPDNLPVYVSNVVYGRMMMFSMTSTASEDDIRATLQAAYNGIGANVQGNLSAKQKTILSKAKISIASLGGDANASISMIKSGNWKDYFTESAALTSAAPLSYTFRNLGDGSIAKVTETTEYNIKECTAIVASPGVFNFPAETTFDLSDINMPVETFKADMNGDGREDLVFNHLSGNVNQIKIGLNNGMGGFDWTATTSNTEAIGSSDWQNYRVVFGDFDGDGKEDMVWSKPYAADNITYVGLSKGDGTFSFHPASHAGYGGWKDYTAFALDYDNDGSDELIWNELKQTKNHIYTSTFDGTTFTLNPWINLGKSGDNWNNYTAYVGQVNGGGEDLIFNEIDKGAFHSTYTASFNGNNFTLGPRTRQGINFAGYKTYLGNMGGNSNTDLIYNKLLVDHNYIHRDYAKSDGSFDMVRPAQELVANEADWRIFRMDVGDVSGDGYDDLIWSIDAVGENTNRIYVGLANSSGEFDFSPVMQTHPATAVWSQFKPLVLDVNGDGKKDVLWLNPGATTVVYQALSK